MKANTIMAVLLRSKMGQLQVGIDQLDKKAAPAPSKCATPPLGAAAVAPKTREGSLRGEVKSLKRKSRQSARNAPTPS